MEKIHNGRHRQYAEKSSCDRVDKRSLLPPDEVHIGNSVEQGQSPEEVPIVVEQLCRLTRWIAPEVEVTRCKRGDFQPGYLVKPHLDGNEALLHDVGDPVKVVGEIAFSNIEKNHYLDVTDVILNNEDEEIKYRPLQILGLSALIILFYGLLIGVRLLNL